MITYSSDNFLWRGPNLGESIMSYVDTALEEFQVSSSKTGKILEFKYKGVARNITIYENESNSIKVEVHYRHSPRYKKIQENLLKIKYKT